MTGSGDEDDMTTKVCFQKEEGRSTVNIGGTVPLTGILDGIKRRKQAEPPRFISLCFLDCLFLPPPEKASWPPLPPHGGLTPQITLKSTLPPISHPIKYFLTAVINTRTYKNMYIWANYRKSHILKKMRKGKSSAQTSRSKTMQQDAPPHTAILVRQQNTQQRFWA